MLEDVDNGELRKAKGIILLILTVTLLAIIGLTSAYFFGNDNIVEETAEDLIKTHTSLDIDLTPLSREK